MMLPEGLIIDVLLRLPVKSIIHCKYVCKRWHDIVSDPYFVKLHMSTSRECLLIHELSLSSHASPGVLKWVEMEHDEAGFDIEHVRSLDFTRCIPHATSTTVSGLGSVNGLVSCWDRYNDIFYILNPVLNEYIALPRPKKANATLGYGFGGSSAAEEEYKVVKISCQDINSFETEVYTLGTDRWKSLGLTTFNFDLSKPLISSLYFNGHLYWPLGDDQICDFDLTTETFELFPSLPAHTGINKKLVVLKGRICCMAWSPWLGTLDIWVMKGGSWYKEITLKNIRSFKCSTACVIDGFKGTSNLLVGDVINNQLVACCLDTDTVLPLNLHGCIHKIVKYRPTFLSLHNFGPARVHAM